VISGIVTILTANTDLITLIGEDKIYPLVVPEKDEDDNDISAPYLAVMLAAQGSNQTKNTVSGVDFPLVQVNVHASSYDELEEVSEAVRAALEGVSGTYAGYSFSKIWFLNALDRPDLYQKDRPSYPRSVQFNCIVKRT
jgi:hypothetical protein